MNAFVKSSILFLLSLPPSWFLLVILASQTDLGFTHIIGAETHWGGVHDRTLEWASDSALRSSCNVLFFGSSTCYEGIDPRALEAYGLRGFNFCSAGQGIGNSAALLPAVLSESEADLVVLDLYPNLWQGPTTSIESARDWALNGQLSERAWSSALLTNAWTSSDPYNILLSLWNVTNRLLLKHKHNAAPDSNGIYKGMGFVARTFPPLKTQPECPKDSVRVFSEPFCSKLEAIKEECEKKNVKLVLVIPPQLCPEIFEKPACWSELSVIDGLEWPGHDKPELYYDDHHLVAAGAERYSAWLASAVSLEVQAGSPQ